jgi:glycerate kinase
MNSVKVLLAFDKFKDSLSAKDVIASCEDGLKEIFSG